MRARGAAVARRRLVARRAGVAGGRDAGRDAGTAWGGGVGRDAWKPALASLATATSTLTHPALAHALPPLPPLPPLLLSVGAANLLHNILIRAETGVPLRDTLRDLRLERLHLRLVPHPHRLELLLQVVLDVVEHLNAPRLLDHQRLLQSEHVPLDGGELVLLILMLGDYVVLQPAVESLELVDQRIQPGRRRLLLFTGLVGGHNVVGRRGAADRLRHC